MKIDLSPLFRIQWEGQEWMVKEERNDYFTIERHIPGSFTTGKTEAGVNWFSYNTQVKILSKKDYIESIRPK